jgi:hypothetical protein
VVQRALQGPGFMRVQPVAAVQRNAQPYTTVPLPHAAGVNWFVPGPAAAVALLPRGTAAAAGTSVASTAS